MSYDTSILLDPCDHCGRADDSIDLGNMTSNVGAMYRVVMPGPYPGGGRYAGTGDPAPRGGLPGLSGLRCSDALPILRAGLAAMAEREEEMRAMEPDNGWGSYEGAVACLVNIADVCEQHPGGTLAVGW